MSTGNSQTQLSAQMWWTAFISIALVEVVLVIKLFTEKTSVELLFAIGVMAVLILITTRLPDLNVLKFTKEEISVTLGEFKKDLNQTQEKVDATQEELLKTKERINKLFLLSLSEPMFKNLEKLDSGRFGPYKKTKSLERELYHLRDVGYIDVKSIQAIPSEEKNLSSYVKITETGQEFVKLRKLIERENP